MTDIKIQFKELIISLLVRKSDPLPIDESDDTPEDDLEDIIIPYIQPSLHIIQFTEKILNIVSIYPHLSIDYTCNQFEIRILINNTMNIIHICSETEIVASKLCRGNYIAPLYLNFSDNLQETQNIQQLIDYINI